jgi:mannose-6-phosphate isomerase-like protein (cupin superfamily)
MRLSFALLLALVTQVRAQTVMHIDTIGRRQLSGTTVTRCFGDSLCTSFVIVIPEAVALHKHVNHSEHVLVLEGEAEMHLGDSVFTIRKGDLVFIEKNVPHSAKSVGKVPLKVLSLQAPIFDGKDRVMLQEKK